MDRSARCQPLCAGAFLGTTSLVKGDRYGAHRGRQIGRLPRACLPMLKSAIAAGMLCLVNPNTALAQNGAGTDLPPVVVVAPTPKPKRTSAKRIVPRLAVSNRGASRSSNQPAQEAPVAGAGAPTPAEAALDRKMEGFDQARDHILPKFGATSYTVSREAIETMPQGDNQSID
jgi:hypothetical protein